jgi:predicted nucleic acid-binding protein
VHDLTPAVVFDINVYVEAIAGPASDWPLLSEVPPRTANASADCLSLAFDADDFRLFASPHILTNLTRILRRAGMSEETTLETVNAILDIIDMTGGAVIDPPRAVFDVADYEDNLIMDLAVATDAILVVSEDTDLTSISPWRGRIPIMRPREFAARMIPARRRR